MRDVTWSLVSPKTVERSEGPVGCFQDPPFLERFRSPTCWRFTFLKLRGSKWNYVLTWKLHVQDHLAFFYQLLTWGCHHRPVLNSILPSLIRALCKPKEDGGQEDKLLEERSRMMDFRDESSRMAPLFERKAPSVTSWMQVEFKPSALSLLHLYPSAFWTLCDSLPNISFIHAQAMICSRNTRAWLQLVRSLKIHDNCWLPNLECNVSLWIERYLGLCSANTGKRILLFKHFA